MKLHEPKQRPIKQIAILVSGLGLGLVIGAVWDRPTEVKAAIGLALATVAFSLMVLSEIGLL